MDHNLETPVDQEFAEAMKDGRTATVHVHYEHIEGYHVFTSPDVEGLYVASKNAEPAFNQVPVAIKDLILANTGLRCEVEVAVSFREFVGRRPQAAAMPPALRSRDFVVREAA